MILFTTTGKTLAQEVDLQKGSVNLAFDAFVQSYLKSFDAIWRNPEFTPSEIITEWGTDAAVLFQRSTKTRDFIDDVSPGTLDPDFFVVPYTVTINADGSATVTDNP